MINEPPCIIKSNQSIGFIPTAPPSNQVTLPKRCGSLIGEKPRKSKDKAIIVIVELFDVLFFIVITCLFPCAKTSNHIINGFKSIRF